MPLVFWRFARLPAEVFPFWRCSSLEELRSLTSATLARPEIAMHLDRLAGRPVGHFARVRQARQTSASRRELDYAADLLVSAVTSHHSGRKGGIALAHVGLASRARSPIDAPAVRRPAASDLGPDAGQEIHLATLPTSPRDGATDALNGLGQRGYELLVDPEPRVTFSPEDFHLHECALRRMADLFLATSAVTGECLLPIGVDSMRRGGDLEFFDTHVPGRALGLNVLPVAWAGGDHQADRVAQAMANFASSVNALTGGAKLQLRAPGHSSAFHELDQIAWAWFERLHHASGRVECNRGAIGVTTEVDADLRLPLLDTRGRHLDRVCWREAIARGGSGAAHDDATYVVVARGDVSGALDAVRGFGGWAVAKPRRNVPWWHAANTRVAVVFGESKRHHRVMAGLLDRGDAVIERLNVESRDGHGRSGEFRSYALLHVNPGM